MTFTIGERLTLLELNIVHRLHITNFILEPVISEGNPEVVILEDGWTAVSLDDSRSAQFEHTVLITEEGVKILTQ